MPPSRLPAAAPSATISRRLDVRAGQCILRAKLSFNPLLNPLAGSANRSERTPRTRMPRECPPAFRIEPAAAGTGSAKRYQSPRNAPASPAKRSGSVPHDWLRSIEWREGSCRAFHVHAAFFSFSSSTVSSGANTPSERAKASKSFSVKLSSPCWSIRKAALSRQEPKRTRLRPTPSPALP